MAIQFYNGTYIKLFRNLLNWRWYKDGNTVRLFIHLLLIANISDAAFENITVHRGEVVTSYERLADDLGLSIRNVRTALNHLKSTSEVTSRSTSKYTIISIKNYNEYQQVTSEMTSDRQTSDKQVTSDRQQYKKNKKKKKNKNYYTRPCARESTASYDIEELMKIK
ncbi:MAG: hypothetical protein K6F88_03390 [Ruminococcus sp.]|nr:hypothetical protein [Ruminococcus sp.]